MRIGIITEYYLSDNYGGNLQAYALCEYLNSIGFDAEQICYRPASTPSEPKNYFSKDIIIRIVKAFLRRTVLRNRIKEAQKKVAQRNEKIFEFNREIRHSERIYDEESICDTNGQYDIFITGSDVIWKPKNLFSPYFLPFVKKGKRISYASSIAVPTLDNEQKEMYRKNLLGFSAISVREEETVKILGELSETKVEWVCDPVFLLSKDQWLQLSSAPLINERYVLAFFLGDSKKYRKIVSDYSNKKKLKIVTLPFLLWEYRSCDQKFGDIQLIDVSPRDLLSLIYNADVVFTDSFHVSAISIMLDKEFFCFPRTSSGELENRLRSLVALVNCNERYCNTKKRQSVEYVASINETNYRKNTQLENLIEKSKEYLNKNIRSK